MLLDIISASLKGVKYGTIFTKWGKWEEIMLNGVNTGINVKLGGKNWNLL